MKENNEIEKIEKQSYDLPSIDLTQNDLPDLNTATELPIDLGGSYWTPESAGESKRVFFIEIKSQKVQSFNDPNDIIDLDCVVMAEQDSEGVLKTIFNGSRRLVGALEQYVESGMIKNGTPLKITYHGKRKNKTNSNSSDNWSIRPLIININQ